MSQDAYRPPTPARSRPTAPPPPGSAPNRTRAALHVVLPDGVTCRSWEDFLAVSAQKWQDLRDHLVSGRLGAAVARAGYAEWVPDPNSRSSPDERLDDWLDSLPTSRKALPELDVQPGRIDLEPSADPTRVPLRIANVGYRLLRFRIQIEPPETTWLILPASVDGLEMVTVESTTLDLTVTPVRRANRPRTATLRIESNGGERLVTVSVRPSSGAATVADGGRSGWNWSGPLLGAALGLISRPMVLLGDRLIPLGRPLQSTWLVMGILGLLVGAWIVGRKASLVDRLAGSLAGCAAGLLAADVAILAAEAMPTAPWWWSMLAWSALGGLAAVATGVTVSRNREAPQ